MIVLLNVMQFALSFIAGAGADLFTFNIIAMTAWSVAFSVSMLFYRYHYAQKRWNDLPITKFILTSFIFSIGVAHVVTLFYVVLTFPYFWNDIYAYRVSEAPNISEAKVFFEIYVGNVSGTTLFSLGWIFLYVGITKDRSAKASLLDNLRLQNSLKEAQISSLSNQLNPHFLFNSLNNIRFMIHENAQQADNMITSLSEVLRYSLESSQHEKRPLSKELEVISRYIDIVNIQYEDRLKFKKDISDDLMDMSLPPMLLQMLLENAVKHGLEHLKEGGKITLSATQEGEDALFVVVNDVPKPAPVKSNSTGLGLENIRQRLALIYGKNASLTVQALDATFKASIKLPVQ